MPWGLTPVHLIVILVIVLIVVGPGKLPDTGAAIGKALRGFKDAVDGNDQAGSSQHSDQAPAAQGQPLQSNPGTPPAAGYPPQYAQPLPPQYPPQPYPPQQYPPQPYPPQYAQPLPPQYAQPLPQQYPPQPGMPQQAPVYPAAVRGAATESGAAARSNARPGLRAIPGSPLGAAGTGSDTWDGIAGAT